MNWYHIEESQWKDIALEKTVFLHQRMVLLPHFLPMSKFIYRIVKILILKRRDHGKKIPYECRSYESVDDKSLPLGCISKNRRVKCFGAEMG